MSNQKETQPTNIRFTTLVNPTLLSQIKFVSYLTNQKLYECMNKSMELMIKDFEYNHQTNINTLINLQPNSPIDIEISVDGSIEDETPKSKK
jgi:hypothetical protein